MECKKGKVDVLLQGLPWTEERLSRLELMGMVKKVNGRYRLTRRGERVYRALIGLKRERDTSLPKKVPYKKNRQKTVFEKFILFLGGKA